MKQATLEAACAVSSVDAFLVVFSVTDAASFSFAAACLQSIRRRTCKAGSTSPPPSVILVANKNDLVRNRLITDIDAQRLSSKRSCKYIEVSAFLDHRVDELLAGVVAQVRLRQLDPDCLPIDAASVDQPGAVPLPPPPLSRRRHRLAGPACPRRRLQNFIGQLWSRWTRRCVSSCKADEHTMNSNCTNLFLP